LTQLSNWLEVECRRKERVYICNDNANLNNNYEISVYLYELLIEKYILNLMGVIYKIDEQ
jgi:hypothetical protein